MLIYLTISMVSVQELFHLQLHITLVAFCLSLLKCLKGNFLLWGRRLCGDGHHLSHFCQLLYGTCRQFL